MFKNKKVLITGGCGFIGSNIAIKLVDEGADVTIVDSMLNEYGGNIFNIRDIKDNVKINYSDMRDSHSLRYIVKNQDYIFNLAGQVSHQDSMRQPFMDLEMNTFAQLTLLETCRQYNPNVVIVYASTRQVYGVPHYLPVDEKHPVLPPDINGINKLTAEYYHRLYTKVYGIPTICLRLTNTYGPRQLIKNARQGVIGWFVNRVITGNKIQLYGSGEQIRDFNYVDDVVEAMLKVATCQSCYGDVYNLSGEKTTLRYIAEWMINYTGTGTLEKISFPEERKRIDIGDFYGTSKKLEDMIGWKPKTKLKDGLKKMIDYYINNKKYYVN